MPMNEPENAAEDAEARDVNASSSYAVLRNRDFLVYLIGRFVASLALSLALSLSLSFSLSLSRTRA